MEHPSPDPSIPLHLRRLVEGELPRSRDQRYAGEGFSVTLLAFADSDAERLESIYERCRGVYEAWLEERDGPRWPEVTRRVSSFGEPAFLRTAQTVGRDTSGGRPDRAVYRVLHDVRGGGLAALIALVTFLADEAPDAETLRQAVLLARDHAKMMRQAIRDIDREGRAVDEQEKQHDIDDVAKKWRVDRYQIEGVTAAIEVVCCYEGGLASCCLEAAAVDRVLYNYMNNATRFSADGRVSLHIFPIGDDIRFVIGNAITVDHARWLEEATRGKLGKLFEGGLTRGGQGIGLVNCAELVAAAYGQSSSSLAVEKGHVGAKVRDGRYLAWFHWPAYG